ncbi:hypothetical protein FQA47_021578, partial [Oryzias melastigma]
SVGSRTDGEINSIPAPFLLPLSVCEAGLPACQSTCLNIQLPGMGHDFQRLEQHS